MTLTYTASVSLNPGIAPVLPDVHVFRCNSLFDPDFTAAGHQPRGFDQMSLLFQRYMVVGSRMKASFISSNASGDKYIVGIAIRQGSTVSTNNAAYMEQRNSSVKTISSVQRSVDVNLNFSASKYFSVKHPLGEADLGALATADPVKEAFYHIFAQGTGADDPGVLDVFVSISFAVVFQVPLVPAES